MKTSSICAIPFGAILVLSFALQAKQADVDSPQCREMDWGAGVVGEEYSPQAYGEGLLWKLSKGEASSHLFGTIHVSDADVQQLPSEVVRALGQARELYLESISDPETRMLEGQTMAITNASWSPKSYLDEAMYQRAVELMAQRKTPHSFMDRVKPWAIFLKLSYPPSTDPIYLDRRLKRLAEQRGIPVGGLQSRLEFIDYLDGLGREEQIALVIDKICFHSGMESASKAMKEFYSTGHPGKILSLRKAILERELDEGRRALNRRFHEATLNGRNRVMAERMLAVLPAGAVFFAVGAAHLPGEQGVLSLLAAQGYLVERLY
ncbi:MAG: TraB/GumN family protein [Candidatus Eutrophobiaceae bacterium]